MHIVKLSPEFDNMPEVVASPADGVVRREPMKNDWEDIENTFERYYYGGRVQYRKPRPRPKYYRMKYYKESMERKAIQQRMIPGDYLRNAGMWDYEEDSDVEKVSDK